MRFFYILLFTMISTFGYSQHKHKVTTILDSPTVDIDDALALDSKGNLYGSNFGNYAGNTVYKVTPTGEVSAFVTDLKAPNGLAFDSNDNLFVVEFLGGAIHKYDSNGNLLKTYEVGGYPSGLIKEFRSDNMIFTNSADSSVNKLSQDGTVIVLHKGAPLLYPVGLAYSKSGKLFVGNYEGREIHSLNCYGELEYVATVPDSGTDFPYLGFITYAKGSIYATVYGEHKIYKVNPRKIDDVKVYAGSIQGNTDGNISKATFSYPAGIIASKSGKELYISEYKSTGNVRKITRKKKKNKIKINLKVSPNPVSEILKIKGQVPSKGSVKIKIFNLYGRNVFECVIATDNKKFKKEVNLKNWSTGLYQVVMYHKQNKISKRIIVKK